MERQALTDVHIPRVSIVIPVRDRAAIVERTLESVARQTHRPLSLIVVDNASADNTLEVVERWAAAHRAPDFSITVVQEPKPGAAAARNRGLDEVVTDYVMFFDSDDTMRPGLLAAVEKQVSRPDAPDIVGWGATLEMPHGARERRRFPSQRLLWNHLIHCILATQRFAARTSLVRSAGAWNDAVRGWDDYELGVRLLCENPRVEALKCGPMVDVNFTEQSITGRTFSADPAKWEHALDLCEATLRHARRPDGVAWISYRRVILAAHYAREGKPAEAHRLLETSLRTLPARRRWLLRLCYRSSRIFPHGTYLIPSLFWRL